MPTGQDDGSDPMNRTLLTEGEIPGVETLALIIGPRYEHLALWLREADGPVIRLLGQASQRSETGWASATGTEVVAVTASWTTRSRTGRGPLHGGVTVVQVIDGGRDAGEGWAAYRQYVVDQVLEDHEAAWIAALAVRDAVPVLVAGGEL